MNGGYTNHISGLEVKLRGYEAKGQLEVKLNNFLIYEQNLMIDTSKYSIMGVTYNIF